MFKLNVQMGGGKTWKVCTGLALAGLICCIWQKEWRKEDDGHVIGVDGSGAEGVGTGRVHFNGGVSTKEKVSEPKKTLRGFPYVFRYPWLFTLQFAIESRYSILDDVIEFIYVVAVSDLVIRRSKNDVKGKLWAWREQYQEVLTWGPSLKGLISKGCWDSDEVILAKR